MKIAYRGFYTFVLLCLAYSAGLQAEDNSHTAVQVEIVTDMGAIVVEVYPGIAPTSAGSFLKYVDEGLYSDAGFYRTVRLDNDNGAPKIEVIQGGLLNTDDVSGVAHETTEQTGLKHTDGALSLARAAVGTGSGAAFFICIGDQPALDYGAARNPDLQGFAVFGKVLSGMDVVRKIHVLPGGANVEDAYTKGQILAKPVQFLSVRRLPNTTDSR